MYYVFFPLKITSSSPDNLICPGRVRVSIVLEYFSSFHTNSSNYCVIIHSSCILFNYSIFYTFYKVTSKTLLFYSLLIFQIIPDMISNSFHCEFMLYVLTHSNIFIWVKFWLGWKWQTCFATKSFAPSWRWPPSKFSFAWFTCVYKQVRAYLDISCPPNSKELTFCTDLDAPGPRCRQQSCISKTTLTRIKQLSWE